MHDDRDRIERRLRRTLRERLRPAIHTNAVGLDLSVWHVPDEPVPVEAALNAQFVPFRVGEAWGPAWGTSWFRASGLVPAEWSGRTIEAVVDLGFEADRPQFQAEGLVYSPAGTPIKALNPRNDWIRLGGALPRDGEVTFFIEAAANPLIVGPITALGDRRTAGTEPLYRLSRADLTIFETEVWELVQDLDVLDQLMHELSPDEPRRWEILRAIERSLDAMDLSDVPGSAIAARHGLADALARPAHASAHRISAIGHAHIDSAWLWPVRETVRKVSRTVANATALMDDQPAYRFAMSQAQQLAWLKDSQPALYRRVRDRVASGQFIPVGGMWVESDTNLPGGEALARQFVRGKRFFLDEFGLETEEVWLPDSFGYSGALPQLIRLSGSRWFLSQKMSWNETNAFPHHTFLWEGIDGSRVFSHLPPVDTYNSELSGAELAHAARNFREKGWATRSLVPFGLGDGGGGPTREMLARAERTSDLEGSPRVAIEPPSVFFRAAEAEYRDPPVWSGEMYLELHRGTYTSQARTKRGNRRSEHLLREAELWSATAAMAGLLDYPYADLDRIWKQVLLLQFHDILPGSSIAWVYRDAESTYAQVAQELEAIIALAVRALAGDGEHPLTFNAAPHERNGVPALGAAPQSEGIDPPVSVSDGPHEAIALENGLIRVELDRRGGIGSLHDLVADREVVAPGAVGNLLQLYPDLPNDWDAWDVDAFYRNRSVDLPDVDEVSVIGEGPHAAGIRIRRRFGSSSILQEVWLRAGQRRVDLDLEIDWHESETFLKVAFPLDVHADRSAAEIQFGHIFRATHENTSWDAARFEICAQRWVHVGEPGYGVALVNDSTYGHDVSRATRPDGGTTTTARLSLLRAPRFPDPQADVGVHHLRYALVVGADIADAVREGYRINLPERVIDGGSAVAPLVSIDDPGVVVEAVKLADDRSGDVIVRIYEALGGRARARLTTAFELASAEATDLLERPLADRDPIAIDGRSIDLRLRPFQILTLRLRRRPT